MSQGQRRLAAIMFTDMVGYTALAQSDESLAMKVLERHNRLLRPFFPRFHGREVKAMGDSFLVEFSSALDATSCAVEIQSYLHDYNLSSKDEWKIKVRIGVHLGDVIHRRGEVLGDAVNIASRIEPVAEPEGVCVSDQVFGQVRNKASLRFLKLSPREFKNLEYPVDVYKVVMPWETSRVGEGGVYPANRIAILPFASYSPDPNDSYFADGMTDEIISTVSGISGLSVISRTSAMTYKGSTKNLREIGRELGVGSVLEGSFKKAGDMMRVTVQLVDAVGDKHLWVQSYDRRLDEVFEVQSDVAKHVAEALRVRILSPEIARIDRRLTNNASAYSLYLKGRLFWNKRRFEDLEKAASLFEQSISEDPGFAPSYLGLANCLLVLRSNFGDNMNQRQGKAKQMLAKAVELDPGAAESHATMGIVLEEDYQISDAQGEWRKAIELKPSYAEAHLWYFRTLVFQQRWDEALEEIENAMTLDPLSAIINFNHAWYYFHRREHGKALELLTKAAEVHPDLPYTHWLAGFIHGRMKLFDEMHRDWETYIRLTRDSFPLVRKATEVWAARFRDDKQAVERMLPELEANLKQAFMKDLDIAELCFFLGKFDQGFEWLEKSYSEKEEWLLQIKNLEPFDQIRSDSRYLDLVKRLGLD